MKRKIYNELLEWKQKFSTKEALLVEGARRIGKSYIVEEFARNEYRSYMLIDFSKVSKEVKEIAAFVFLFNFSLADAKHSYECKGCIEYE